MTASDYENLNVYKAALDWVALADGVLEDLPRGRGYLADQMCRAATPVPLNIAEGAGEFANNEKARFYRIAKRSAVECAAILDICLQLDLVDKADHAAGRELLLQIVSMLVVLVGRIGNMGGSRDASPDREDKWEKDGIKGSARGLSSGLGEGAGTG